MHENIRLAVMNNEVDPYTQLAGATRELYGHRMRAYADLSDAKQMESDVKFKKEQAIGHLIQTDEGWKDQKNVPARDSYLRQKLSYLFGLHQSHLHNLQHCKDAYELARMSLSELRLQVDLLKLFMGDVNEEGREEFETDDGGGEEEVS